MLPLGKWFSKPPTLRPFHSTARPETQRDFNEYFHKDRGATFKELRKQIYKPLFSHLVAKEKARLSQQEKVETVAFTPPIMSDEIVRHQVSKVHSMEQFKTLPVEHGIWSLPPLPLPAVSRRDSAGAANGLGRRKTARAVVNMRPGSGKIRINGRNFVDYFPRGIMLEPIVATEKYNRVDINIKAWGGGYSGQAQAIRHALGRALVNDDPENRYAVKDLVKLDARRKERKKTGLLKARKRPQWKRR